jgi:peptidoglycan/xylan/chitin deacetylase (PgdA/CDA1 family)
MIKITAPLNFTREKDYIFNFIFNESLGVPFEIIYETRPSYLIMIGENQIEIKDSFFVNFPDIDKVYVDKKNLPSTVQRIQTDYLEEELHFLWGDPNFSVNIQESNKNFFIGFDLIATIFFMLSRWEEIVEKQRDIDHRFDAKSSLAFKHDFLDKPIVDYYIRFLKNIISEISPDSVFKPTVSSINVSCDVDEPFDGTVSNLYLTCRTFFFDMVKRKSFVTAFKRLRRYIYNSFGNYKYDYNYTFDRYMDICEKHNLKATFYFICNQEEPRNCRYNIEDKNIVSLLKMIHSRGHDIGLHGSYQSYVDQSKIIREKHRLQSTLDKNKIDQKVLKNRQHYLRFEVDRTPEYLDDAGFLFDSTGGFADLPGYRFGTSNDFSMWGWIKMTKLSLIQQPLILMECSVIDTEFMNLKLTEKTIDTMLAYKKHAGKYGQFNILWHNSHFKNEIEFTFFERLLE